jgi:hypothetical protein
MFDSSVVGKKSALIENQKDEEREEQRSSSGSRPKI